MAPHSLRDAVLMAWCGMMWHGVAWYIAVRYSLKCAATFGNGAVVFFGVICLEKGVDRAPE